MSKRCSQILTNEQYCDDDIKRYHIEVTTPSMAIPICDLMLEDMNAVRQFIYSTKKLFSESTEIFGTIYLRVFVFGSSRPFIFITFN